MKIYINWKKVTLILVDILIGVYLVIAITSWNKPKETQLVCTKVDINIEDENENGFLKTPEIKRLLTSKEMYPFNKPVSEINTRAIEEELVRMPFVKTAQCYITQDGHASISITQRTPILRVKAYNGEDYYVDDAGGVMPNSQYTSDMVIVTGYLTQWYACHYISLMAHVVMENPFWRNQIEQINVLPDRAIEIIPRVGEHIINIGRLPETKDTSKRAQLVSDYVDKQLKRMDVFYKYGLSQAGWNKYSYISLEFRDQVVCTKR